MAKVRTEPSFVCRQAHCVKPLSGSLVDIFIQATSDFDLESNITNTCELNRNIRVLLTPLREQWDIVERD